jgi:beta-aspartyl-peptidase (threonine type)
MNKISLAIHGGAGTIDPEKLTPQVESAYKAGLQEALENGYELLLKGKSSLDAVEKAVKILEDNPLFNAGKGSVFSHEGKNEMDASIMCGKTMNAGAVAGVKNVKNPIVLSRLVMTHTEHVFLFGAGAEELAKYHNLQFENDDYFYTKERYLQWQNLKNTSRTALDHSGESPVGTVGAVARDWEGNLAAATSTGGMTNKKWGRIGDTPLIGAGTYADNSSCAISCTGHGEFFIKNVVAYDISCLMKYKGYSLYEACEEVVMKKLKSFGGDGGVIAVDKIGNISMPFNCRGMYRGAVSEDIPLFTAIFK